MNPVLLDILETSTVQASDGSRLPVHSQIPPEDGAFLQAVVRRERPRHSLEIGLAYGISTLYICEALAEVGAERHWAVDPLQHGQPRGDEPMCYDVEKWKDVGWSPASGWRGIGLANLERAGFGNLVEHLPQPSHLALPSLVRDEVSIDFAFIDGWHTFDYVLVDFFFVDLLLRVGGVIAFDDCNDAAIRKALRYILRNRRYEVIAEQRLEPQPRPAPRRAFDALAARSGRVRRWLSEEAMVPNADIGLPRRRCVAIRKLAPDVLGDGSNESRRWNDHSTF